MEDLIENATEQKCREFCFTFASKLSEHITDPRALRAIEVCGMIVRGELDAESDEVIRVKLAADDARAKDPSPMSRAAVMVARMSINEIAENAALSIYEEIDCITGKYTDEMEAFFA